MSRDLIGKSVKVTDAVLPTCGRFGVVQSVAPQAGGLLLVGVRFAASDGRYWGTIYLRTDQVEVVHAPTFAFDGDRQSWPLVDMLAANRDDEAVCEWLRGASVGDHYAAFNGCRRVA